MNDKDKQELDVLKVQVQHLQVMADQRNHELIALQVHTIKQEQHLSCLLNLLGLLSTDLDAPGALTSNATLLLRLSRPEN